MTLIIGLKFDNKIALVADRRQHTFSSTSVKTNKKKNLTNNDLNADAIIKYLRMKCTQFSGAEQNVEEKLGNQELKRRFYENVEKVLSPDVDDNAVKVAHFRFNTADTSRQLLCNVVVAVAENQNNLLLRELQDSAPTTLGHLLNRISTFLCSTEYPIISALMDMKNQSEASADEKALCERCINAIRQQRALTKVIIGIVPGTKREQRKGATTGVMNKLFFCVPSSVFSSGTFCFTSSSTSSNFAITLVDFPRQLMDGPGLYSLCPLLEQSETNTDFTLTSLLQDVSPVATIGVEAEFAEAHHIDLVVWHASQIGTPPLTDAIVGELLHATMEAAHGEHLFCGWGGPFSSSSDETQMKGWINSRIFGYIIGGDEKSPNDVYKIDLPTKYERTRAFLSSLLCAGKR